MMPKAIQLVQVTRDELQQMLNEAARLAVAESRKAAPHGQLVTKAEAAKMLRVCEKTLERRVKDGRVKPFSVSPIRFDIDQLRRELAG